MMPVFREHIAFEIARGLRAFLNLEAGLTRGTGLAATGTSDVWVTEGDREEKLRQARARIERQNREIEQERVRLTARERKIREREARLSEKRVGGSGIRPENMVWIFGSGRSGSTWLRTMMSEMKSHRVWEEPMVGLLFGQFYDNAQKGQLKSANFIMGNPHREGWVRSVRNFVLDGATRSRPDLRAGDYLVIKEPNGSMGAPLLTEALPESRMIFLVRDPRDVVASVMDAAREGSWMFKRKSGGEWKEKALADTNPEIMVKRRAEKYLYHVGSAKRAYEGHVGPKALVRYEDLREDTLESMKRIYKELGIPVEQGELERVVEKHSWENISEDQKGEGKFYRKASPGGWREDLTAEQVEVVERITAPLLTQFYAN